MTRHEYCFGHTTAQFLYDEKKIQLNKLPRFVLISMKEAWQLIMFPVWCAVKHCIASVTKINVTALEH
jgi:hypothetical protein